MIRVSAVAVSVWPVNKPSRPSERLPKPRSRLLSQKLRQRRLLNWKISLHSLSRLRRR
jgi:hypothetical protein